jgi:MYXO-CTERM domain-containing protein
MKVQHYPRLACLAGMVLCNAGTLNAATLYDNGGFEAPRFLINNSLETQDAPPTGQGPWVKSGGTSTALVQTNGTSSGLPNAQAVLVQQTASTTDSSWYVSKPFTPAAGLNGVSVTFDMNVNISNNLNSGPSFGVEMFDASGATPRKIAGLLLNSATGELQYEAVGTGSLTPVGGPTYARNVYRQYTLTADFSAKTYTLAVNGTVVQSAGFVDALASTFSYAPIVTRNADALGGAQSYFDSYTISSVAVPEPAMLGMLSLGAIPLIRRRTRA